MLSTKASSCKCSVHPGGALCEEEKAGGGEEVGERSEEVEVKKKEEGEHIETQKLGQQKAF